MTLGSWILLLILYTDTGSITTTTLPTPYQAKEVCQARAQTITDAVRVAPYSRSHVIAVCVNQAPYEAQP